MKLKEERIGVEFTNSYGEQMVIIEYVNAHKVQVMFLDEHKWTTWTDTSNLKRGSVISPFTRTVHGVGYLGTDETGSRLTTTGENARAYTTWSHMMERCYSGKYPTYSDVTVCDRWHSFSQFLEDLPKIQNYEYWLEHENERVSLNKDMYYTENQLEHKNKVYSLETCRFLTNSESSKETRARDKRTRQATIEEEIRKLREFRGQ